MGQYHKLVCPTKAEYVDNYSIGSGLKAWEHVHGYTPNAPHRFLASLGARKLDKSGVDEVWGWR